MDVFRRTNRRRLNKRSSLNLSINAIVILILAITMLGLGLGFINKLFKGAEERLLGVTKAMDKQMREQLEESGKTVELNDDFIEIPRGTDDFLLLGIKNTLNAQLTFNIWSNEGDGLLDCFSTPAISGTTYSNQEFKAYTFPTRKLNSGDSAVMKVLFEVPQSASLDTYICEFIVDDGQVPPDFEVTKQIQVTITN